MNDGYLRHVASVPAPAVTTDHQVIAKSTPKVLTRGRSVVNAFIASHNVMSGEGLVMTSSNRLRIGRAFLWVAFLCFGVLGQANAQSSQGASSTPAASSGAQGGASESDTLQEVIVTAQKRSENLMEVPSSISVLSGARLDDMQLTSLSDFASYIPGLATMSGGSPGQNTISIRGISTGYSATTATLVGTYIDDIPVGSSSAAARGGLYGMDLMPYDIDHIEVLRGPQGTLYGADAMGGLVKYVLRKPDLTQSDLRTGGEIEDIDGTGSPSGGGRAAVNIPLINGTLGLRVSGFYRSDAGYIDNVGTGTKDSNHSDESGGRASMLWDVNDKLSVEATALLQDINVADETGITVYQTTMLPVYGSNTRSTNFPEPYRQNLRDYALSINWDLNFATLSSSTSRSQINGVRAFDLTPDFGPFTPMNPDALVDDFLSDKISKFTEEVRLTSPENQRLQWILGLFHTNEDATEGENVPTFTPAHAPLPYNLLNGTTDSAYLESAVFGNATLKLTDSFDIGGGVRYAKDDQDSTGQAGGVFGGGYTHGQQSADVTTWMADARYHFNADDMVYARVATGYRAGGPITGNQLDEPHSFAADTLTNYEIGIKGTFLDRRLQLDLAVFYIDWNDIQLQTQNPQGLEYTGNAGRATSSGFELTTAYVVTEGLRLGATLDSTNAYLTQNAPTVGGLAGNQLPENARWSASATADYSTPITAHGTLLLLGGAYRYKDKVNNQLAGTGDPEAIGPQNVVDLYAGLRFTHLTLRLYGKNVFNDHAYTGMLFLTNPAQPSFVPVQPVTVGISADYHF
jgi:iron complex outermembrane recepter protein